MKNVKGFTLVELMIAMTISLIVLAGYYASFKSQHDSFDNQEQINMLQQNLRSAMTIMSGEIRMAGYDPTCFDPDGNGICDPFDFDGSGSITFDEDRLTDVRDNDNDGTGDNAGDDLRFGITSAGPNSIAFTKDISGDGDVTDNNENIIFGFMPRTNGVLSDSDDNGIADVGYFGGTALNSGAAEFGRDTGGGFQALAEGITAVSFAYAFDNDNDGGIDGWGIDTDGDTDGDGEDDLDEDLLGNNINPPEPLRNIIAVRIWLLGATRRIDRKFANNMVFVVGDKVITPAGNPYLAQRRLRMVTTTIQCRNMGL